MSVRRSGPPGWVRTQLGLYIPVPTGTGAVENLTDWSAPFAFDVESAAVVTAVAGTGAGATRTFRILKGASTVVATATVTLASQATVGGKLAMTVTTADAHFEPGDLLTVDWASGGTAFTAGAINLLAVIRQQLQTLN